MTTTEGFHGGLSTQVVIGGGGGQVLVYDGTPANGNLILSISSSPGSDAFGNNYPAGLSLSTTSQANSGGAESIQFAIGAGSPGSNPYLDSIIVPLIQSYLEVVGPKRTGSSNRASLTLLQDLVGLVDGIELRTQDGDISILSARAIDLSGAVSIGLGSTLQVGNFMPTFGNIQFGEVDVPFAAVSSVSGTLTYPQQFPVGLVPVVVTTVTVGSNLDILFNWTGPGTNTSRNWRMFQKSGTAVTGTAHFDWLAIG